MAPVDGRRPGHGRLVHWNGRLLKGPIATGPRHAPRWSCSLAVCDAARREAAGHAGGSCRRSAEGPIDGREHGAGWPRPAGTDRLVYWLRPCLSRCPGCSVMRCSPDVPDTSPAFSYTLPRLLSLGSGRSAGVARQCSGSCGKAIAREDGAPDRAGPQRRCKAVPPAAALRGASVAAARAAVEPHYGSCRKLTGSGPDDRTPGRAAAREPAAGRGRTGHG